MIDNWEGESGYLKLNENPIWRKKGMSPKSKLATSLCGNNDFNDALLNNLIDKVLDHKED